MKNSNDECVLVPGTTSLPNDDSCSDGGEFWYERTPYRKIPYSSCVDGLRPDRGEAHRCPGFGSKGIVFWLFMVVLPFGFTALVATYYYRRSGLARGYGLLCFFFAFLTVVAEISGFRVMRVRHLETRVLWPH